MGLITDLRVEAKEWTQIRDLEAICMRALEAGFAGQINTDNAAVDVLLTDDDALAALNTQWRGKTGPTDVLSFPAEENPEAFLGDIAIAYGVATRDAVSGGKTITAHLSHLLVHGMLHLLGHDHIEDKEAEIMENLERAALAKLGIADPYSQIV